VVDTTPDDDDPIIIPPSAERVAARALVLSAIVCRAAIEGDAGNSKAEEFRTSVLNWIRDTGLVEEAESDEIALLERKLGGLSDRQRIDSSWRGEGLIILAWALGSYDLPAYEKRSDPYPIVQTLGFREERSNSALFAPRLRSPDEIGALADTLFSLHWRLRQYSLDKSRWTLESSRGRRGLSLVGLRLVSQDIEVRGCHYGMRRRTIGAKF
jgi:Domain of unknown function (DUF4272)